MAKKPTPPPKGTMEYSIYVSKYGVPEPDRGSYQPYYDNSTWTAATASLMGTGTGHDTTTQLTPTPTTPGVSYADVARGAWYATPATGAATPAPTTTEPQK